MSMKLIHLLMEEKLLTEEKRDKLIKDYKGSEHSITQLILSGDRINENKIKTLLCKKFNIKFMDIEDLNIEKEAVNKISREYAYKNFILPFKIKDNKLHILCNDPFNRIILEEVKFIVKRDIVIYYANREDILKVFEKINDGEMVAKVVEEFKEEQSIEEEILSIENIENAPAVKITSTIISTAIIQKASDIHLEPLEDDFRVRMRIDGILQEVFIFPRKLYSSICARIKIEAGMDISKKFLPQDGKIQWRIKEKKFNLRISSMPTIHGEKLVIRILYNDKSLVCLEKLGFNNDNNIRKILNRTRGIILVVGPTGSGKSTTLYALIEELEKVQNNIITIEDPVEYKINGINQINVNNKAGLTFAKGLRSLLRQDPDVIMIGEIRDEETAEIAVKAAITGHLVFSTLHTYDAVSSILRLIDMKIPYYLAADAVTSVIAQRLVRKICPKCKISYEPSELEINNELGEGYKLYKGRGCSSCNNTGYKGRTVVYELLELDERHRRLIHANKDMDLLRGFCIENGMVSLSENCMDLVRKGITTYEQYMKVKCSY